MTSAMKSILTLKRIKIENANAISGITYGFPSVTHFLGFVHALSRELLKSQGVALGGVGIICHDMQVHTHRTNRGEHVFALTRNPLTKKGKTAPFNEEGKVHLEVSLMIACDFSSSRLDYDTDDNEEDKKKFEEEVKRIASSKRIAGGYVTSIEACTFETIPDTEEEEKKFIRKQKYNLLPGFILRDRSQLLRDHWKNTPNATLLDALLDFYVLKSEATLQEDEENKGKWNILPKPALGWFAPIQVGYKALSPLYEAGKVLNVRDKTVPFRFVESVYTLGEWTSPHKLEKLEDFFWNYQIKNDFYICFN